MAPLKIKVIDKKKLYIQWDDNIESLIPLANLRKNCPCAACMLERENKPANYIPLFSHVQITLTKIEPVGTYAIRFYWQDDHDDGIYNYELLRKLGDTSPQPSLKERGS